jgi:Cof subfamily protein (haloacid dehalogenase superfamily)
MRNTDIQMVFLDIDGTLFVEGKLVQSGIRAVEQLTAQGIPVAICTGRSVLHAKHVQDTLDVPYGIFFNGGLVRTKTDELFATPFQADDVAGIVQYARSHGISTILHTHERAVSFAPIPEQYKAILAFFDFPSIEIVPFAVANLDNINIFQINAFMTREWDADFETRFPASYIYRWDTRAVDFQRRKSDKSIGAKHLLDHLGIKPEHALHIGDGGNDIGMFKTLGYSYAMGNATDDVKQFAKRVTTNAEDDGVARALHELGLIS